MFLAWPPDRDMGDLNNAIQVNHYKDLERAALDLIKRVIKSRIEKKKPDIFSCPVAMRQTVEGKPKEIRFLNFSIKRIDGESFPWPQDKPEYPGALGQAEQCFKGLWRLATDEEEESEYRRQAAVKKDLAANVIAIQSHVANMNNAANSQFQAAAMELLKKPEEKKPEVEKAKATK